MLHFTIFKPWAPKVPTAFFCLKSVREASKNINRMNEGEKMNPKAAEPVAITPSLYKLGTRAFPAFLSMGAVGMIIEGGTGPTAGMIMEQIKSLGIQMEKIQYVFLTHTHADHIGALPHLKRRWPHIQILSSATGAKILNTRELYNEFLLVDLGIAQLMKAKSEIDEIPATPEDYRFEVDMVVKGGDTIELGNQLVWEIIDTPGHSPCHISAFEKSEGSLIVGDATGFYVPEKDAFWPNYFLSLKDYVESIRKLSTYGAERAILSHYAVIEGDTQHFFEKAIAATKAYHEDILDRLDQGHSVDGIAMEGAHFVSTLTDIQPFKVMYDLSKLLIGRSRKNGNPLSFELGEDLPPVEQEKALAGDTATFPEPPGAITLTRPKTSQELKLNERLGLVALIDEGMRSGLAEAPVAANLFSDLWKLVDATAKGSKINRMKFEDSPNGFQNLEIKAESGDDLGRLNMIYLKKPVPCYYLVYVEVAAPYRRKGLGNLILKHFAEFLTEKSAVGILDNIIPQEDPTNDIYLKHSWVPVEDVIGDVMFYKDNNYMVFIPPSLRTRDLKQPFLKLMYHLKRKRAVIDIRENETMVRKTLNEFKELYEALMTYFHSELEEPQSSVFIRFLFTRFVTKFISFRRRIGDLVGYTGGESTEQVVLDPKIQRLQVKSYAPREFVKEGTFGMGDLGLLSELPDALRREPAQVIELLPNYRRPAFLAWLKEHRKTYRDTLTLEDLMDLGFDPTRLKEIDIDGESYIFERAQARQIEDLQRRNGLLDRISRKMPNTKIRSARLKTNPILLIIRDRGNAYVLRRKIDAIHWEEAIEQLKTDPILKSMNEATRMDRIVIETVRRFATAASDKLGTKEENVLDLLTPFVSWDLENNRPKMVIDSSFSYMDTLWIA